ncbi:putative Target of EGR1 protein 1 [Hypsibius exemplaris]|uniref:Target of EGR1 protein 1 n=1 Tax=Hypsibius exemplaris TaxID=2072580 RepID=A0A1W0X2S9_HYPEX|nr:putative Target of EGR1 protein 1 [Hypsibius exemplaris]
MDDPEFITIFDVTSKNVEAIAPRILREIEAADFVAIDQELSGLGNTAGRGRLDLKNYYTKLQESAERRRVISIGISCFKSSAEFTKLNRECCDPLLFTCTSFNILLLPDEGFLMDGSAQRFLVAHRFDLNRWIDDGIIYSPLGMHNDFMASVVQKLLTTKAILVFHNGLTDLAYFYRSFYNPLPKSNEIFAADIADMFGDRLFDTKVICNKVLGWRMHSLEYCYKKAQRITEKSRRDGKPAVWLQEPQIPPAGTELMTIPTARRRTEFAVAPKVGVDVCDLVYHFGFCNAFKTGTCKLTVEQHQMDLVLDVEEQKSAVDVIGEKTVTASVNATDSVSSLLQSIHQSITGSSSQVNQDRLESDHSLVLTPASSIPAESPMPLDGPRTSIFNYVPKPGRGMPYTKPLPPPVHPQRLGSGHFTIDNGLTYNLDFGLHSAGFDAFMTGYVFAVCLAQLGREAKEDGRAVFKHCHDFVGRVHITGKSEVFSCLRSLHVKASARHLQKIARIRALEERVGGEVVIAQGSV